MPKFTHFKILTLVILSVVFTVGVMVGHQEPNLSSLGFIAITIFVVTVAYNFIQLEGMETDRTKTQKEKDRISVTLIIMILTLFPAAFVLAHWLDAHYDKGDSTSYWYFGGLFLIWWILGRIFYATWNRISPLRPVNSILSK